VAIARALVTHPVLIFADEPTANLDSESAETVMGVMQRLNESQQTTFIFSTHDPRVMHHAHRILRMRDGILHQEEPRAKVVHLGQERISD